VNDSPLVTISGARQNFREWLDRARKSPDPASQPLGTMKALAANLNRVEAALRDAPRDLTEGDEWKSEIARYTETLRELRARLRNFEITLRIRSAQVAKKQVHLDVIHSWADLVKHVG
jgi:hypothetical protein